MTQEDRLEQEIRGWLEQIAVKNREHLALSGSEGLRVDPPLRIAAIGELDKAVRQFFITAGAVDIDKIGYLGHEKTITVVKSLLETLTLMIGALLYEEEVAAMRDLLVPFFTFTPEEKREFDRLLGIWLDAVEQRWVCREMPPEEASPSIPRHPLALLLPGWILVARAFVPQFQTRWFLSHALPDMRMYERFKALKREVQYTLRVPGIAAANMLFAEIMRAGGG